MYVPRPNLKSLSCPSLRSCVRLQPFTSTPALAKNHYDSLGITPAATQADVKSAYYKLSKVYHPDRNDGSEASSQKFREVSAAYEVLGNVKLRKMYDKGLIGQTREQQPEHPEVKFYRSRERRSRPPPPDGKTPIYDFDEWSKQHYGSTFARDMRIKNHLRMREMVKKHGQNTQKNERFLMAFFALTVLVLYVCTKKDKEDYDRVRGTGGV